VIEGLLKRYRELAAMFGHSLNLDELENIGAEMKQVGDEIVGGCKKLADPASYFEVHVTTAPPLDEKQFISLSTAFGFRPSTLYKENGSTHNLDAFTTYRDKDFMLAKKNMELFTAALDAAGIKWRRRKIEAIIHDERRGVHA